MIGHWIASLVLMVTQKPTISYFLRCTKLCDCPVEHIDVIEEIDGY